MLFSLLSAVVFATPPEAIEAFRIELRQYRIYNSERSTQLLEQACSQKYQPACEWKKKMRRKDMLERFDSAPKFFLEHCSEQDPWSCIFAGWGLSQQAEVPSVLSDASKDPSQAYRLFEQACNWGQTQGCTEMAKMRFRGVGIIQDTKASIELLSANCIENNPEACIILGTFRTTGIGMEIDMRAARQLIAQACDQGDATGCAMQGALLMSMGNQEEGLKHLESAKEVGSAEAYYRLGEFYFFDDEKRESGANLLALACRDGRPDACHFLGVQYASGKYLPQNDTTALNHLSLACLGSTPESCHAAGLSYHEGVGTAKNEDQARRFFQDGCEQGFGESCFFLGVYEEEGLGGEKDIRSARKHYELACEEQDARACINGGLMLVNGTGGIAIPEKAFSFFERACALGESGGCASLGALYENGVGTETNMEKASLLYNMACDGGDKQACDARDALENKAFLSNKSACENGQFQACYHVAIAYEKGQGVSLSPEMAVQTANQGCEGGSMAACTKLGYYYIEGFGTKRNLQSAGKHFEEACESNFGPGCFNLGLMSMEGRGQPKSLDSAIGYFKQACKLGDGRGCNHAGRLLRQQNPPDVKDAVAVLKDGCVQESGESCVQLGAIHLEAPPNYEIAFNAFLRGCELGSGSGCFNGAVVLNQGHLKDVDPSLIGQLLQQGCQLGYAQACEILRQ